MAALRESVHLGVEWWSEPYGKALWQKAKQHGCGERRAQTRRTVPRTLGAERVLRGLAVWEPSLLTGRFLHGELSGKPW